MSLWVEKYRPKSLKDVCSHEEVKKMLEDVKRTGRMPHLLFYGPAGTGKTSTILAFARDVFGPEEWHTRVLELNASDERGIDMVRERVKQWSKLLVVPQSNKMLDGVSSQTYIPPWKIVLLDEADMMTLDAQTALRRVIEDCSEFTRFVIICNYVSKIIDAVASRCVKCRFQPIPRPMQIERLKSIVKKEAAASNLSISDDCYEGILNLSKGDLRMAINTIQTVSNNSNSLINPKTIIRIIGRPSKEVALNLIEKCLKKSQCEIQCALKKVTMEGWDTNCLLQMILEALIFNDGNELEETKIAKIANIAAEAQRRLIEGASEYIQLAHVLYELNYITNNN